MFNIFIFLSFFNYKVSANTDTTNVAGATAVKAMVSQLNSKTDAAWTEINLVNHWSANINIYRKINSQSVEIILDYTAGKKLTTFDAIANGLPPAAIPFNKDTQIAMPAIIMEESGMNKRSGIVAITNSGQLILGDSLEFKEKVIVNAVYKCSG